MPTDLFGNNTGNITGTNDTRLAEAAPTTNYGNVILELNKYGSGDWNHLLLAFPGMSSLPSNITVTAASIFLLSSSGTTNADTASFYRMLKSWSEGAGGTNVDATWNQKETGVNWQTPGAIGALDRSATLSMSGSIGTALGAYVEFVGGAQLFDDIEKIAAGTNPNYGWHIERTDAANDTHWRQFSSKETGLDGERPYLSVTYTVNAGSAALTGTITAATTEADIVAGGKTIVLTLTGDTWVAAGTGPIGSTADTQAIIDGITSAQAEAAGWNAVVKVGIDIADVVRTSATVCTITLDPEATYDITAQEVITTTIPAAALVTSASAIVATPTFTVDVDVTAALGAYDSPILDAEQDNVFNVTGFGSNINQVNVYPTVGFSDWGVTGLTGTGDGPYTYDMTDVAAYTVNTIGSPFTSASWQQQLYGADGTDSDIVNLTVNPKAGWAVVEAVSPVKTAGSVFENFTGIPVNTDQVYYPTAGNTSVAADGTLTTDLTSGTISMLYWDSSDNNWKPFDIIISAAGVGGARRGGGFGFMNRFGRL